MKKGNKNRRNTPKKISYNSENQMMTLFKIIIVLIVIFGVFYGLTLWRTRDKALDDTDVKETEIQYDEILVGTLLKQNDNEYYVLYADLNAVDYSKYKVTTFLQSKRQVIPAFLFILISVYSLICSFGIRS